MGHTKQCNLCNLLFDVYCNYINCTLNLSITITQCSVQMVSLTHHRCFAITTPLPIMLEGRSHFLHDQAIKLMKKLTGQFANKPTRSQSSRGLDNMWTSHRQQIFKNHDILYLYIKPDPNSIKYWQHIKIVICPKYT